MSLTLNRCGEDASDYFIGYFGDARLAKIGALFFKRTCENLTTCVKSLAKNRGLEAMALT